jgi:FkbM family methyltransferase
MPFSIIRRFLNKAAGHSPAATNTNDPNWFLAGSKGVIHVGASNGQERDLYNKYPVSVLWVEAIPAVYQTLLNNLQNYPRQKAVNALITDRDGDFHDFHISNNSGESSSIYEFHDHKAIWPEVSFTGTIRLRSATLPAVLNNAGIKSSDFDVLVLDVQGAELLVVKGAGSALDSIKFVKAEAADFESYKGACTVATLSQALEQRGFVPCHKECFARKEGIGSYFNILYKRAV